ncbi:MAG: type VI secretion IcmF C-terminal domain-containing protein, partial [Acetobacteraceae bacterium]
TKLKALLGQAAPAAAPPGKAVDERYAALRAYAAPGGKAPVDDTLGLINALQKQLATVAGAPPGGGAAPAIASGPDPGALLQAEASQDPQPIARWLDELAFTSNVLRGAGAKKQAAGAFGGPGGPADLCRKAVDGRYPFFPGASKDIPLADFARLFAPGGLLDKFFTAQIQPFVDTSGPVWKAQAVQGVAAPVTPGALAQFQRASKIRDLFFAGGGAQPSVSFTIAPVSLDDKTSQVTLSLGAQTITYAHGPLRPTSVTWPGPQGMINARLVFEPAPKDGTGVLQASGPWSLFRLFDKGTLTPGASSYSFTLTFQSGDRHVEYELHADSVLNPFDPAVLRAFRCPGL